jgi:hypothetical protein
MVTGVSVSGSEARRSSVGGWPRTRASRVHDGAVRLDHVELAVRDPDLGLEHVALGDHPEFEQALGALEFPLRQHERGVVHRREILGREQHVVLLLRAEHQVGARERVVQLACIDALAGRGDAADRGDVDEVLVQHITDAVVVLVPRDDEPGGRIEEAGLVQVVGERPARAQAGQVALQGLLLLTGGRIDVLAGGEQVLIPFERELDGLIDGEVAVHGLRRRVLGAHRAGRREAQGQCKDQEARCVPRGMTTPFDHCAYQFRHPLPPYESPGPAHATADGSLTG